MTALTMVAQREDVTSLRPVPWRRMAWVTWRQHRAAVGAAVLVLGALAVYLWLSGLQIHHSYATACRKTLTTIAVGPYLPVKFMVQASELAGWQAVA